MNKAYNMMRHCVSRLFTLSLFTSLLLVATMTVSAQNIRYVKTNGDNTKDGTSWTTAKKDIQDAINDLVNNNLSGEVWVAAGTYYPTESTESSSSPLYKAFKIPAGITVRGGFDAMNPETDKSIRLKKDNNLMGRKDDTGKLDGEDYTGGVYTNKTILSGNLTSKNPDFTWDTTRKLFKTSFYGNAYHVVWFAMNGFTDGRANGLLRPAKLEGCVIENGNAFNSDLTASHPHNAYGGGIYMVANSFVYNCEVRHCEASRNGGGIYMDGGGIVRRTYVHDCQALGVGTEHGYGGGICEDGAANGNTKTNPIVVAQSAVTNCVGRYGGGMGMRVTKIDDGKYTVVVNSTLVNNNTATTEGGGIYTFQGGGVAACTIVRNQCNGSGIVQNGMQTGRAGGLYCRDNAYIGNTVVWGNECQSNNDIQYVSSRSHNSNALKTKFLYSAVSKNDNTDWSGSIKMGVLSLSDDNNDSGTGGSKGFPLFFEPTPFAGYYAAVDDPTGKQIQDPANPDDPSAKIDDPLRSYVNWVVSSESFLTHAGIATVDLDYDYETPAPTNNYDMQFSHFNARPTIGAYVGQVEDIAPAENVTYDGVTYDYAFFVEPGYINHSDNEGHNGENWTHPARFLGNVLDFIANPATYVGVLGSGSYNFTDKNVAVFVKEGTVNNTRTWGSKRIRVGSLEIPSNVSIFGSFSNELTENNLTKRNPVLTPTIINAKTMDRYDFNIAHLISIEGKQNILIDGFKLTFANANSTQLGNDNKNGAAITLKNCAKDGENVTIHFRNITVSNCLGDKGTVVYADNASADFENCIFHNNTTATLANSGLVYGINSSDLRFDHCNVLRSVGHASYLDATTKNNWKNSMFYGNLDRAQDNTNSADTYSILAFDGAGANATNLTGERCMFDRKSYAAYNATLGDGIPAQSTYHLTITYPAGTPGVPPSLAGVATHYGLNYVYKSGTANGYPRMVNPTKNAGYSTEGDITYYGRATSFEPHNDNPVVNAASYDGEHTAWGKDITTVITRDFGGLPDIGAVESHVASVDEIAHENGNPDGQLPYGAVLYVRDYTSTGTRMKTYNEDNSENNEGKGIYNSAHELLDGSSWDRAINGNATYRLSGTRTYKDFTEKDVMAYRLHVSDMYLNVENGTLNRVNCADSQLQDSCTIFVLCDNNGKVLPTGSGINTAKRLMDASTGEYLYLDYTNKVYSFRTSLNPPAAQATATITASGGNYTIRFTANKANRYIYNGATIPSSSSTAWVLEVQSGFKIKEGSGEEKTESYDKGDFNGLQYAVNKSNILFSDEYSITGDLNGSRKQVWVGAGVYSSDPNATAAADNSSETDPEAENCYVIQDGVDVYGAFPKVGTPGMNERQALVSQYVHVLAERGCTAVDYETILEPATKGVTVDVTRRVLGQTWDYNPKKTGYKIFYGAKWDGFTLRDGVLDASRISMPNRHGGAGAAIYNNVTLKNVVVTNNTTIYKSATSQQDFRAGGIYCDGGTLDAGYVINNQLLGYTTSTEAHNGAAYGGGMYIYRGTVFNSVIARNRIHAAYADGAGTFIEDANFFNNTIVYNKAEGTSRMCGGVAIWNDAASRGTDSELNVYNCIIAKNVGTKLGKIGNANMSIQSGGVMNINYCITEDAHSTYVSGNNKITFSNCKEVSDYTTVFEQDGTIDGDFKNLNLRLKPTASNAINQGIDNPVIHGAVYNLTDYNDMDFDERIQDCRIDIGAYEFNGATVIAPHALKANGTAAANIGEADQLVFYVTPEGYGTTNASDPENAACAQKLQKVIDAAGRYKIQYPAKQVIVKVANSYDLLHPDNGTKNPGDDGYIYPEDFTYYATRTTDNYSTDTRLWSTMIPRGVEVWGGYSDVAPNDHTRANWTNDNNGFYTNAAGVITSKRDITANPTYFDSYFYNRDMKINANTYHVVTFTEHVYDKDGHPYLSGDYSKVATAATSSWVAGTHYEENLYLHMSDYIAKTDVISINGKNVSNRAVLDGIFVTGGNADGKAIAGSDNLNVNGYGGAAIVTDYAYVRNCILKNNNATNGGGLALTNNALVSGSLIIENTADNQGGGLYVFENGAVLSNGVRINSQQGSGPTMDYNMAHVLTSTIVNNEAQQGGGVWFSTEDPNARLNSVAVWQNAANDQANVCGMINPEQPAGDQRSSVEFYPFSYSAIQDVRASGTNNQNVSPINKNGVRFVHKDYDVNADSPNLNKLAEETSSSVMSEKYAQFGYYGLTNYSILNSTGMPLAYYDQVKQAIAIADDDFMGTSRTASSQGIRKFVEIGARALDKQLPTKLMLRIFVAQPGDVNMDHMATMQGLDTTTGTDEEKELKTYYSQEGSTFAFPMQTVQEALDYIKLMRTDQTLLNTYHANNLPFEILVGKGEWHPTQDLNGNTENALGATFAIPEGVSIYGGFNPQGGGNTYYGRHFMPNTTKANNMTDGTEAEPHRIDGNVEGISGNINIGGGLTIQQWPIEDICTRRALSDNNANGIIEPWEFKNQTIFSGDAQAAENNGVYHVITVVPDQNVTGALPKASIVHSKIAESDPTGDQILCDGYHDHEEGQNVRLNGIIVTGGYAYNYVDGALDDYGSYTYYQGGGLFVDGNRYNNDIDHLHDNTPPTYDQKHKSIYGVGYRDIPVSVVNCQFRNNRAGYGGAISTNTTLDVFASSFEQNLAVANSEDVTHNSTPATVMYPGEGGAIHATHQLTCFNTLFANNEARSTGLEIEPVEHTTFRVPAHSPNLFGVLRGCGGAIHAGLAANIHIVNCDLVKNKANMYPAIYTMNPTKDLSSEDNFPSGPFVKTPDYSQVINTVAWQNEVNPDMLSKYSGNSIFKFASKLMINAGKKNRTGYYGEDDQLFDAAHTPASQEVLDGNRNADTGLSDSPWQETAWFCAYEKGCGFTPHNEQDFRLIDYKPFIFAPNQVIKFAEGKKAGGGNLPYQNCNIEIASENAVLEGPNFVNPSKKAGVDGFMESADWSPARINNLTDNGSGMVEQTITNSGTDYTCTFNKWASVPARSVNVTSPAASIDYTHYTDETTTDYVNKGAYTVTAYAANFPEYKSFMAVGTDKYMQSAKAGDTEIVNIGGVSVTQQRNLPRISYDPNPTHNQTYIDIGVYEYQHARLNPKGSEVDLLWVSTKEKPENGAADGSDWDHPTSDLQRAIETLLASRNGHRKEIRIMDGEYSPTYNFMKDGQKYLSYYINTLDLNANTILPLDGHNKKLYEGVKSLTIKGGYSTYLNNMYDPETYKVVIRQQTSASANTDHLFYIADATQRYGYDDTSSTPGDHYGDDNNWGAWPNVGEKTTHTFPIYIDGVTLVNDKAKTADAAGAAIYYADYAIDDEHKELPASTTAGDVTKTVNSEGIPTSVLTIANNTPKVTLSKSYIIGSGNGKNSSAVYVGTSGGEALVYNVVFHSNPGKPLQSMVKATTINNTFALNGNLLDLTVAESKILNSVLWRNNPTGSPATAAAATAWGDQCHINAIVPVASATGFAYNTYTGGPNAEDTNYGGGGAIATSHYNVGLNSENGNIARGPNFKNPYLEAVTIEQIMQRSFDLNPSFRLLNHGNNDNYKNNVEAQESPNQTKLKTTTNILDLAAVNTTRFDAMGRTRIMATTIDLGAIEYQYDLDRILFVDPNKTAAENANGKSWGSPLGYGSLQDAIDLVGIYHANHTTEEAYVFVKGASSTNEGLDLRETITMRDGVSVYGGIPSDFIADIQKAGADPTDAEIADYIRTAKEKREGPASPLSSKTTVNGIKIPTDATLTAYEPNHISSLIDGFVVTAGKVSEPVVDLRNTSSDAAVVVRNTIVAGNDLRGAGVNAVEVSNGLIYEVLMRDNKVAADAAVLNVGENGYVVSATVEGKTNVYNKNGVGDISTLSEHDGHVFNSIINWTSKNVPGWNDDSRVVGDNRPFVGYKELSGYFYNMHDANLNYQLTETSDYIDDASIRDYNCNVTHGSEVKCHNPKHFLPENLKPFVNYLTDRDLLGVPRVLAGISDHWSLDRGAFETWKVEESFHTGQLGTISTVSPYMDNLALDPASRDKDLEKITTKFYPHYGNVVYVMQGKFATADAPGTGYDDTNSYPGLILLKEGASFYANGRALTCPYVIVERKVKAAGSIVALPYNMNYSTGVSRPYYNEQNKLDEQRTGITNGVYTYNGVKRSDWKHIFHTGPENNDCWTSLTGSQTVDACKGVFYSPVATLFTEDDHHNTGDQTEVTLRFAAKGTAINDYVYTENPTYGPYVQKKTVTLTKYDDSESTAGGADFTDEKDMGWNLIGLPWLVSSFKPYETTTADASKHGVGGKYMMHIPHEMWLYFDGVKCADGTTNVNGDGGYYSVNSWECSDAAGQAEFEEGGHTNPWHVSNIAQQAIWVGEGIFMQTATLKDTENLTFYRPLAPAGPTPALHGLLGEGPQLTKRFYFDSSLITETMQKQAAGAELISTECYTVDGIHLNTDSKMFDFNRLPIMPRGTVVIVRKHYSDGTSTTQKLTF